jgi:nitroreductase
MSNLIDIIKKRRSIRRYKDKALDTETIRLLLEAARLSPTARNMQELKYKVVTDKAIMGKLSDDIKSIIKRENPALTMRETPLFYGAPLLIIITGPKDNVWVGTDAALAAQNIMLQATELGLGSCFIGMAKFMDKDKALMELVHLDDGQMIGAVVICGHSDEEPAEKEKKMDAEFL